MDLKLRVGLAVAKSKFLFESMDNLMSVDDADTVTVVQCVICAALCGSLEAFLSHFAQHLDVTVPFVESTCCRLCHTEQPPNTMGLHLWRNHDAVVYSPLHAKSTTVEEALEVMKTKVVEMRWVTEELRGVLAVFKTPSAPDAHPNPNKRSRSNEAEEKPVHKAAVGSSPFPSPQQAVKVPASSKFDAVMKAVQVLASTPELWEGDNFAAHTDGRRDEHYSSQIDALCKAQEQITESIAAARARLQSLVAAPHDDDDESAPATEPTTMSDEPEKDDIYAEIESLRDDKLEVDTRLKTLRKEELEIKKAYQVLVDNNCVTVDAVHALFDAEEEHVRATFTGLYDHMEDIRRIKKTLSKPPQDGIEVGACDGDSIAGAFKLREAQHKSARYRIKCEVAKSRIDVLQSLRRGARTVAEAATRSEEDDHHADEHRTLHGSVQVAHHVAVGDGELD